MSQCNSVHVHSESVSVDCKVYLRNSDGVVQEIRRFTFPHDNNVSFEHFRQNLTELFPQMEDKALTITWIDEEGDEITVRSTEEFQHAVKFYTNKLSAVPLKLYLTCHKDNVPSVPKENVVCDGCNSGVIGHRYKCVECVNYNLCIYCEVLGLHGGHWMLRIPKPLYNTSHHGQHLPHSIRKFLRRHDMRPNKKTFPNESPMTEVGTNTENEKSIEVGTNTENEKSIEVPKEDDTTNNETSVPTNASVVQRNSTSPIILSEEWTIVDSLNRDIARNNSLYSVSSPSYEMPDKQVSSSEQIPSASKENSPTHLPLPKKEEVRHSNPNISRALEFMIAMGFSNREGMLTHWLDITNGNMDQVLDMLQSEKEKV